jgi:hypothetical protein
VRGVASRGLARDCRHACAWGWFLKADAQRNLPGTNIRGPGITGSAGFAYVGAVVPGNFLSLATLQVVGTTTTLVSQPPVPGLIGQTSNTNPALANSTASFTTYGSGDRRINITQPF